MSCMSHSRSLISKWKKAERNSKAAPKWPSAWCLPWFLIGPKLVLSYYRRNDTVVRTHWQLMSALTSRSMLCHASIMIQCLSIAWAKLDHNPSLKVIWVWSTHTYLNTIWSFQSSTLQRSRQSWQRWTRLWTNWSRNCIVKSLTCTDEMQAIRRRN